MTPRKVWIYSTTETPRCGSGHRLVVADVGRKWARLRPASAPDSRRVDRIPVATFQQIAEAAS